MDKQEPTIIVSAGPKVSPAGARIMEAIARAAQQEIENQKAAVEQLLLEGSDEVTIAIHGGGGKYRYSLPTWRRHPINRLRVELARWRHRRGR